MEDSFTNHNRNSFGLTLLIGVEEHKKRNYMHEDELVQCNNCMAFLKRKNTSYHDRKCSKEKLIIS